MANDAKASKEVEDLPSEFPTCASDDPPGLAAIRPVRAPRYGDRVGRHADSLAHLVGTEPLTGASPHGPRQATSWSAICSQRATAQLHATPGIFNEAGHHALKELHSVARDQELTVAPSVPPATSAGRPCPLPRRGAPPGGSSGAPPSRRRSPNTGTPVATWPTGAPQLSLAVTRVSPTPSTHLDHKDLTCAYTPDLDPLDPLDPIRRISLLVP